MAQIEDASEDASFITLILTEVTLIPEINFSLPRDDSAGTAFYLKLVSTTAHRSRGRNKANVYKVINLPTVQQVPSKSTRVNKSSPAQLLGHVVLHLYKTIDIRPVTVPTLPFYSNSTRIISYYDLERDHCHRLPVTMVYAVSSFSSGVSDDTDTRFCPRSL